ncbi:hypothetical protein GCM10011487_45830 [Steroidobacter agaridevorans]|uniref:Phytanoyl-CoA dioxygenase n=1 Tax=Steroidobacter agaridevorans TaxID=2695856 RepID=A0A829YI84_9GAMM|nr:2OG-Fe(II) oxygenase [Steroidobacter agaridevorans]GFE82583.1 hypothetical protein GCM10011487_45830 [Steroidobacter agaridevorans]
MLNSLKYLSRSAYFFLRQRRWFSKSDLGKEEQQYSIYSAIRREGFTVLDGYKSAEWCERARADVLKHITDRSVTTPQLEDTRIVGVEKLSPYAHEFANDPLLLRLAEMYAGGAETLFYCMANHVTYRGGYGSGGEWHRDSFRRELKALIYLTDVTDADGPFALVKRSSGNGRIFIDTLRMALWGVKDPTRLKDAGERLGYHAIRAKAGTLVLFDTSAIHTGIPIKEGHERLALTNYYVATKDIEIHRAYYRDKVKML